MAATNYYDFLIGNEYGYLTVLENLGIVDSDNRTLYRSRCRCGNEVITSGKHIKSGNTRSCGCLQKEITSERSTLDLSTRKFGRLQPLYIIEGKKCKRQNIWFCQCDCGNTCEVPTTYLTTGDTKSCGCIEKEKIERAGQLYWNELQGIRKNMIFRCYNEKSIEYHNYGGRGIKVCDEWLDEHDRAGAIAFYTWGMMEGYRPGLTIDRIDVNGNYTPWNCRWTTIQEQAWNKQDTRRTKDGYSVTQYAYEYGIPTDLIYRKCIPEELYLFELHELFFFTPFHGFSWTVM